MQNILLFISSILVFISYIVYTKAILKGEARPHRTTRFVLLLITSLTTASLFASGNRVAIWLSGIFAASNIVIFILSIKFGMGGWSKFDIACLVIALLGISLWQLTKNPVVALYSSILADFTGVIPAMIKTYRLPKSEVWMFYFLDVVAAILNIMASNRWSMQDLSYPSYIIFIDGLMVLLIIRPVFDHSKK